MQGIRPTLPVLRTAKGWGPGELAREAGVSYSLIRKAEAGEVISRESAEKICRALGVLPEDVEGLRYR